MNKTHIVLILMAHLLGSPQVFLFLVTKNTKPLPFCQFPLCKTKCVNYLFPLSKYPFPRNLLILQILNTLAVFIFVARIF